MEIKEFNRGWTFEDRQHVRHYRRGTTTIVTVRLENDGIVIEQYPTPKPISRYVWNHIKEWADNMLGEDMDANDKTP